jgi:orotidine-5'-phosphate decarboxylase
MDALRPEERIIIALDVPTLDQADKIIQATAAHALTYKRGSQLFTASGPEAVRLLTNRRKHVFLDLKFHDIPNTVSGAVTAAAALGVKMLNVHASGGVEMMKAASQAAKSFPLAQRPKLLAVTVLTSIDQPILSHDIGCRRSLEQQVLHLATLAATAGLDGVIASPEETPLIRETLGPDFLIVTPGIRPRWAAKGDQKRVMTPAQAIRAGADYIVIGRPVTANEDPQRALQRIIAEIPTQPPDAKPYRRT